MYDIRDCYIGVVGSYRMASEGKESERNRRRQEAWARDSTFGFVWIVRLDHVDSKAFGGTVYVERLRETHLIRIQTDWSGWSSI